MSLIPLLRKKVLELANSSPAAWAELAQPRGAVRTVAGLRALVAIKGGVEREATRPLVAGAGQGGDPFVSKGGRGSKPLWSIWRVRRVQSRIAKAPGRLPGSSFAWIEAWRQSAVKNFTHAQFSAVRPVYE